MPLDFPKRLTIELPALQREGLHHISIRTPGATPALLLERLLADAIMRQVSTYTDDEPVSPLPETDVERPLEVPEIVELRLDRKQRRQLASAIRDGGRATLEKLVRWMFEWGLEAYSESLAIRDDGAEASGGNA